MIKFTKSPGFFFFVVLDDGFFPWVQLDLLPRGEFMELRGADILVRFTGMVSDFEFSLVEQKKMKHYKKSLR